MASTIGAAGSTSLEVITLPVNCRRRPNRLSGVFRCQAGAAFVRRSATDVPILGGRLDCLGTEIIDDRNSLSQRSSG